MKSVDVSSQRKLIVKIPYSVIIERRPVPKKAKEVTPDIAAHYINNNIVFFTEPFLNKSKFKEWLAQIDQKEFDNLNRVLREKSLRTQYKQALYSCAGYGNTLPLQNLLKANPNLLAAISSLKKSRLADSWNQSQTTSESTIEEQPREKRLFTIMASIEKTLYDMKLSLNDRELSYHWGGWPKTQKKEEQIVKLEGIFGFIQSEDSILLPSNSNMEKAIKELEKELNSFEKITKIKCSIGPTSLFSSLTGQTDNEIEFIKKMRSLIATLRENLVLLDREEKYSGLSYNRR